MITRFGFKDVENFIKFIKKINFEGKNVICLGECNGNTIKRKSDKKTRKLKNILSEVKPNIEIHKMRFSHWRNTFRNDWTKCYRMH